MLSKLLSDSTRRGVDGVTVGRTVGVEGVVDGRSDRVSGGVDVGVGSTAVLFDAFSVFSSDF